MTGVLDFLVRHGELILFVYVFADQVGVPLPAVPVLLAAGALAATGQLSFPVAMVLALVASLAADLIWYTVGRLRGAAVLRTLCKISLEPDSCVRRTENVFLRYGVRSLVVAKFVPGLSTVAPPLAGIVGVGLLRFSLYSSAAALLWAGAWMALGLAVGDALEQAAARTAHGATLGGAALGAVVAGYVVFKWVERRRFLRALRTARISADALKRLLDAGQQPLIIDLRTPLDVTALPVAIPGAVRVAAEELEDRGRDLPRDREIVVYCS
ncbi:MAG: VTT domain-containing protein [Candidatus Rokuibacteriota bacterium]